MDFLPCLLACIMFADFLSSFHWARALLWIFFFFSFSRFSLMEFVCFIVIEFTTVPSIMYTYGICFFTRILRK